MPDSGSNDRRAPVIRIFLADDHPLVLSGLKAMIASDETIEIAGEASTGPEALRRAIELRPDVLVLDLCMPGLNGLEVAKQFRTAIPSSHVVVLTALEDEFFVGRAIESGISGFILKRSAPDQLLSAIHAAANGETYLDTTFGSPGKPRDEDLRFASRSVGFDKLLDCLAARWRRRS